MSDQPKVPWIYSEKVKELFLRPLNYLHGDESNFDYDKKGVAGNPICGDEMAMYVKLDESGKKIVDLKWKTFGCASAIASTSALSELAKGKTVEEALAITPEQIADFLGGLPKSKFHCSVLGAEALKKALED